MKKPNFEHIGWMDIVKIVAAVVALCAFGCFIRYMLGQTKTHETEWTRAVYLFQGVEAIAFTAAGFLFGREVHRERAEKAEKRAKDNEDSASNGKALASMVKAKAAVQPKKAARMVASSTQHAADISELDINELVHCADRLFPEAGRDTVAGSATVAP